FGRRRVLPPVVFGTSWASRPILQPTTRTPGTTRRGTMLDTALLSPGDARSDSPATLPAPWWPTQNDEPFGPLDPQHPPRLALALADDGQTDWCQRLVVAHHYLHAPVDPRCNVLAYIVLLAGHRIGCLIFGRPEATRVGGWYGDVEEKLAGRCRLSRWEVL